MLPGHERTRRLWLARSGGPFSDSGMYVMVKRRTKAAFGRSIGLHMARDGAATFIATFHGEHILAASAIWATSTPPRRSAITTRPR